MAIILFRKRFVRFFARTGKAPPVRNPVATTDLVLGRGGFNNRGLLKYLRSSSVSGVELFLGKNADHLTQVQIEEILSNKRLNGIDSSIRAMLKSRRDQLKAALVLENETEKMRVESSGLQAKKIWMENPARLDLNSMKLQFEQINRIKDHSYLDNALKGTLSAVDGVRGLAFLDFSELYFRQVARINNAYYLSEALKGILEKARAYDGDAFVSFAGGYFAQVQRIVELEGANLIYLDGAIKRFYEIAKRTPLTPDQESKIKALASNQINRIRDPYYLNEALSIFQRKWRSSELPLSYGELAEKIKETEAILARKTAERNAFFKELEKPIPTRPDSPPPAAPIGPSTPGSGDRAEGARGALELKELEEGLESTQSVEKAEEVSR